MTNKKARRLTRAMTLARVLVFFSMLIVPALLTVFKPKEDFSENQNRYLAKFPAFSAKKVYSGSFTDGVEKYLSDHFIGADRFVKARTYAELIQQRKDVNDVYILHDRLVEKIPAPDPAVTEKNIEKVDSLTEYGKPVFLMLAPTQAEIYSSELPENAPNPDQAAYIREIMKGLHGITPIDIYSVLHANSSDYIYYRTDHHWTSKGAYLAYQAAARIMGFEAVPLTSYDCFHASDEFRGTFYSKTLYDGIEPDRIDIYSLSGRNEPAVYIWQDLSAEPEVHAGMYFYEYLDRKDKYSVFFGSNQPKVTIKTGRPGGRLLVFKDSYAHSMIPFFTEHYSEITMLDTRYIQSDYKEAADPAEYDQILLMYNISTFMDGIRL